MPCLRTSTKSARTVWRARTLPFSRQSNENTRKPTSCENPLNTKDVEFWSFTGFLLYLVGRAPVANGLAFENQAILAAQAAGRIANLENESAGLVLHHRGILQMIEERSADIAGAADVDPLLRVRESVDAGGGGRVGVNSIRGKRPGSNLLK